MHVTKGTGEEESIFLNRMGSAWGGWICYIWLNNSCFFSLPLTITWVAIFPTKMPYKKCIRRAWRKWPADCIWKLEGIMIMQYLPIILNKVKSSFDLGKWALLPTFIQRRGKGIKCPKKFLRHNCWSYRLIIN